MTLKSLLFISLLASPALATEKGHEGHDHAKESKKIEAEAPKGIYYGTILSIDNAMGYKYLKVKEEGKELWVAIANAPVQVGDKIGYDKKTVMKNFKSKSLKKEFKEIIFASDVYLPEKNAAPIKDLKDMLGLAAPKSKTVVTPKKESEKPAKPFVKKDFYTVEEIFMWKESLKDQTINVKGEVLKVSKQIMKLDWVHISDGTGDASKRTDDLVFTVKNMSFKAGDKVVATGKLIRDKDFGYGYFYNVIIQECSFKIQ
jgi:hypothetical protein